MSSKVIGTHSGSFHADEALAIFMLHQTAEYKDSKVVRSRDPEVLNKLDILVDVGSEYDPSRNRFDHHQRGFTETFSPNHTIKLSSAGLIYKHFGKQVIQNKLELAPNDPLVDLVYLRLYKNFVEAMDGIDNGVNQYDGPSRYSSSTDLSSRVARLNPSWNEANVNVDERFHKAVELTGKEFMDALDGIYKTWLPARKIVEDAFLKRYEVHPSGLIILFDKFCPWQSHLFDIEEEKKISDDQKILYAIFQDDSKSWRVRAVSLSPESFENRLALPEEWRGLRDDELSNKSKIDGCIFVHASGFIGGNKTKEGAIQMAIFSMQMQKPSHMQH